MDTPKVSLDVLYRELLLSLDPHIYLVGGAIRDSFLKREVFDFDFLSRDAFSVARRFAEKVGGRSYFLKVTDRRKTVSVVKDGYTFDFSLLDTELYDNLEKRDFTINAMACPLETLSLLDPFGGLKDLRSGLIRVVSPASFDIDPGRMLRVFRFVASLGFSIEKETEGYILSKRKLLGSLQPERIRFELFKVFIEDRTYVAVSEMMRLSVMSLLVPELGESVGCSQNIYHAYDVWTHTLKALEAFESLSVYGELGDEDRFLVKLSLLLHDAGKPFTKSGEKPDEVHFYGHEGKSAEIARSFSERVRLSKKEESAVERLVLYHMRPMEMAKRLERGELSRREVERFIRKNEDILKLFYPVVISDIKAKGVDVEEDLERAEAFFSYLFDYYERVYLPKKRKPLVRGRDLIEWGFTPSPLFRKILDFVEEMELKGVVKTKEEAKKLVLSRWKPK